MAVMANWRQYARQVKLEACTLYLACRDPRVPWPVRLLAPAVVGYACSPIDLIPDWIPLLGYLDDLLFVPLGLALVIRLMPPAVLADCRERARLIITEKPVSRIAAGIIVALWIIGAGAITCFLVRMLLHHR